MADRMQLAADERSDLADFLESLTPEQWERPSLCEAWTIQKVVAHIISYEELSYPGVAAAFVRGGFRPGRINEQRLAAYREHTPGQLIEILRSHLRPHGLTAGFAGGIGLSDCLIHHQDIRRPLGLPREVPHERLLEALQIALRAPVIPAKRNADGLRLVATDLDWQHGDGIEVTGPAEALLMTLAGRTDALDELEGPGQPALRERVAAAG
ncbi:MAG: maleylpyruvate isomerase family mycothiol-dependent enzyme [Ilumatobacteraceae bacterium]